VASRTQQPVVVADRFEVRLESDLREIRAEWTSFVASRFPGRIFRDFPWSHAWWQAYAPGEVIRIFLLREQTSRSVVGILPFRISRGTFSGFPVRRLELLGRGIGCEDLLIDPEYLDCSKDALAGILRGMKWDIATLSNLQNPSGSRMLSSVATRCGFDMEVKESTWLDISTTGGFESYLKSRSSSLRRNYRAAERRSESIGELSFERYDVRSAPPARLESARAIAEQGWQYRLGGSHFRRVGRKSLIDVVSDPTSDLPGICELWILKIGSSDAALNVGVVNGNQWEGLEVAYVEEFGYCSPGKVLLLHVVEQKFEDPQIEHLVLGAGGGYKDRLSTRVEPVDNFVLFRDSYYGKLISRFKRSRAHSALKRLRNA
jgi:CelD/BcsL family acetyltransferase involved in cellulose biosynthesis